MSILSFGRSYGGEGGIRTRAALTNPNDLANRPLEPLEYFSPFSSIFIDLVLRITCGSIRLFFEQDVLAERVGFEPTGPYRLTGFQDQLLKPLGHLSKKSSCFI